MTTLTDLIPKEIELFVTQGSTFAKQLVLTDNSGVALNLAGLTLETKLQEYYGSSPDFGLSAEIINPSTGSITIGMSENLTEFLRKSRYVFEIKLRSSSVVVRVLYGTVYINNI